MNCSKNITIFSIEKWRTNPYIEILSKNLRDFDVLIENSKLSFIFKKTDIAHFHGEQFSWVSAPFHVAVLKLLWQSILLLLCYIKKVKVVWTVHDILPYTKKSSGGWTDRLKMFLYKKYLPIFIKNLNLAIVLSRTSQSEVEKKFLKINPSLITRKLFEPSQPVAPPVHSLEAYKEKMNISPEKITLLIFGDFRSHKNPLVFIDAFFQAQLTNLHLIVAGNCSHLKIPNRFLQASNISIYSEFIASEKIADFFYAANWVVLPYQTITNSGLLSLSAMHKKPCLLPTLPYFQEQVPTTCGLFYDEQIPGSMIDVLKKLADLPIEKAQHMGETFFSSRQKLSWKNLAEHQISIYYELCKS